MGAIATGTCPKCNTRTQRRHCDSSNNRQCNWWVCRGCTIVFDHNGRSMRHLRGVQ